MARRGHGEGNLYRRADGRWEARASLGGRRKSFYGRTRKEAQEKLVNAIHQSQHGLFTKGRLIKMETYLNQWLEDIHKPTVKASTYVSYRYVLDNHLLPAFGALMLQRLTPQEVSRVYSEWLTAGFAPASISKWHGILHQALDRAVKWELVPRNVCDMVDAPRIPEREHAVLNEAQARQLMASAKGERLEGLLTLAVITGMRKGELRALRWEDVDLARKQLTVRHTVDRIGRLGLVESEPKTQKGRRTLPLPQLAVDMLAQLRDEQATQPRGWNPERRVFPNTAGHTYDAGSLQASYKRLLREAGLPDIPFHNLRHSAASILLSRGVPAEVVRDILGHSSIDITIDIYGHLAPARQEQAMQSWDEESEN